METSTTYWILGGFIAALVVLSLILMAGWSAIDDENKKKDGELSNLNGLISTLNEQARIQEERSKIKEERSKTAIQTLESRRDQLQEDLRKSWEHIRSLQEHAAFIEAMQKLALSCNRCGRLAYPITDTGNRYGCPCGNQFPGARHGLPTPRKPPLSQINIAESRELEDQR